MTFDIKKFLTENKITLYEQWITVSLPSTAKRRTIDHEIQKKFGAKTQEYGSGLRGRLEIDYTASPATIKRMKKEIPKLYKGARVESYK